MSGYSKTPLWKKLGLKPDFTCFLHNTPENYHHLLQDAPSPLFWKASLKDGPFDFLHVFVTEPQELTNGWSSWKAKLKKDGLIWISWPKKTSSIRSTIDGNGVRESGLEAGLVDVKVCAIDEDWSGLKFMLRKEDRQAHRPS